MIVTGPAVVAAAMLVVLGARYATFDPQRFARDVEAELSPFQPSTVKTLHGIAAASDAASVMPLIESLPTDTVERTARYTRTMDAMRQRFHANQGPCERYPRAPDTPLAPAQRDEAADAILATDLPSGIDALLRASLRWDLEEDAPAHRADPTDERIEYFTDAASAWNKLGIAMHRAAIAKALRDGAETRGPSRGDALHEALAPDEVVRGKELWKRYGRLVLLQGALRIADRKGKVDLRSSQLRLIEPGMSRAVVHARLGEAEEEEDGGRWRYPRNATEVSFDAQNHVTGIAVAIGGPGARVVADGQTVEDLEEAALARLMGPPLRAAEGEKGETVLVYDAGPHVRLLVFDGRLTRVELWRRDLVTKPVP